MDAIWTEETLLNDIIDEAIEAGVTTGLNRELVVHAFHKVRTEMLELAQEVVSLKTKNAGLLGAVLNAKAQRDLVLAALKSVE